MVMIVVVDSGMLRQDGQRVVAHLVGVVTHDVQRPFELLDLDAQAVEFQLVHFQFLQAVFEAIVLVLASLLTFSSLSAR